jgi:hypothetical protein
VRLCKITDQLEPVDDEEGFEFDDELMSFDDFPEIAQQVIGICDTIIDELAPNQKRLAGYIAVLNIIAESNYIPDDVRSQAGALKQQLTQDERLFSDTVIQPLVALKAMAAPMMPEADPLEMLIEGLAGAEQMKIDGPGNSLPVLNAVKGLLSTNVKLKKVESCA